MVAENWRYEEAFRRAGELIAAGAIGQPIVFNYPVYTAMTADNKYFHTDWRRTGQVPGGFLLDGGIHHIAAIRMVLGDIAQISASAAQVSPDLPPADTVSAALELESGLTGGYVATYASGAPWDSYLSVIGEKGAVRVDRGFLEISDESGTRMEPIEESQAVRAELADFATAIRTGSSHRNSPEEAFADLATVEAMLQAAATGHRTAPERVDV
jgi:predicted dehydrogenase